MCQKTNLIFVQVLTRYVSTYIITYYLPSGIFLLLFFFMTSLTFPPSYDTALLRAEHNALLGIQSPDNSFARCRFRQPLALRINALGLFVIVSWISFLIPMDVIPGRMALLVTLFLVLVNIFNTVTTNTPKVKHLFVSNYLCRQIHFAKAEGLTAIEAWMLACILFVFGALIE